VYYQGAVGALLVFDVTRRDTYNNVPAWARELWRHRRNKIPLVVIGNKIDLRESAPLALTPKEGYQMAARLRQQVERLGIPYLETSAKTGEKVDRAFELLGEQILAFFQ
jgi:small GTP-binding protein